MSDLFKKRNPKDIKLVKAGIKLNEYLAALNTEYGLTVCETVRLLAVVLMEYSKYLIGDEREEDNQEGKG